MIAKKILALATLCGLLPSPDLLAQASQQELVAALESKDWRARNDAARALLPLAAKLTPEATDALWRMATPQRCPSAVLAVPFHRHVGV